MPQEAGRARDQHLPRDPPRSMTAARRRLRPGHLHGDRRLRLGGERRSLRPDVPSGRPRRGLARQGRAPPPRRRLSQNSRISVYSPAYSSRPSATCAMNDRPGGKLGAVLQVEERPRASWGAVRFCTVHTQHQIGMTMPACRRCHILGVGRGAHGDGHRPERAVRAAHRDRWRRVAPRAWSASRLYCLHRAGKQAEVEQMGQEVAKTPPRPPSQWKRPPCPEQR